MKNTLENKAKFFAQYWGQKLVCVNIDDGDDKTGYDLSDWVWKSFPDDCYLELKPLSSISDKLWIKLVENITGLSVERIERFDDKSSESYGIVAHLKNVNGWISLSFKYYKVLFSNKIKDFKEYAFYRAFVKNGFALPDTDKNGKSVTVEEQIEFGWIKLIKE